jgi:GDP/UDP-N,N'-diacetylbacillosamine 2-epimerase (hydrolysing)
VFDCEPFKESILDALNILYSENFQKILKNVKNPYGEGGASNLIIEILKNKELPKDIKKQFYDV